MPRLFPLLLALLLLAACGPAGLPPSQSVAAISNPAPHSLASPTASLTPDPGATARRLEAAGVERVRYGATDHAYFRIPGGPVFRLA